MSDITVKDIKKAVETLEKNKIIPTVIRMSPVMKAKVVKMLHEHGINTKGEDGDDYVMGMKVIVDDRCEPNTAYVN